MIFPIDIDLIWFFTCFAGKEVNGPFPSFITKQSLFGFSFFVIFLKYFLRIYLNEKSMAFFSVYQGQNVW